MCMPACVCYREFAEQVVFEGLHDQTFSPNYCSAGTNTHKHTHTHTLTHVLSIFVLKSASSVFFALQVTLLGRVVILASPPMVPGNKQILRYVPRFTSAVQRALIWLVPRKGCAFPMEPGLEHSPSVNVGTYFYWAHEKPTVIDASSLWTLTSRTWNWNFILFLPSCPVWQPRHSK